MPACLPAFPLFFPFHHEHGVSRLYLHLQFLLLLSFLTGSNAVVGLSGRTCRATVDVNEGMQTVLFPDPGGREDYLVEGFVRVRCDELTFTGVALRLCALPIFRSSSSARCAIVMLKLCQLGARAGCWMAWVFGGAA